MQHYLSVGGTTVLLIEAEWRYTSVNYVTIALDSGVSPVRVKAIIQTNASLLFIRPIKINFDDIWLTIKNMHSIILCKISTICVGLNVLADGLKKNTFTRIHININISIVFSLGRYFT